MTAPDVRAAHLAHVAALTVDDLTSPLTGLDDTLERWPPTHLPWGAALGPNTTDNGDLLP